MQFQNHSPIQVQDHLQNDQSQFEKKIYNQHLKKHLDQNSVNANIYKDSLFQQHSQNYHNRHHSEQTQEQIANKDQQKEDDISRQNQLYYLKQQTCSHSYVNIEQKNQNQQSNEGQSQKVHKNSKCQFYLIGLFLLLCLFLFTVIQIQMTKKNNNQNQNHPTIKNGNKVLTSDKKQLQAKIADIGENYINHQKIGQKQKQIQKQDSIRQYIQIKTKILPQKTTTNNASLIQVIDPQFYQKQIKKFNLQSQQIDVQNQLKKTLQFWMMTGKNIENNQELTLFAQAEKKYFQNKYQIQKYGEIQICVLVLSYMNEANERYKRNLDSIFQQQYTNFKVYYVDDHSEDKTAELVEKYIKDRKLQDKIKLYKNKEKKGKSSNQFYIGQENCKPGSVMVVIDGDDELIGRQVFKFLSAAYQSTQLYYIYTHSVVIHQDRKTIARGYSIPIQKSTIQTTSYRSMYVPSHLRTWMSDLFLDIKKQDLLINGTFPEVAEDVGSSFQLMQKAGKKVGFIKQYIYRYVMETGHNDYQIGRKRQIQIDRYYRQLPKFDPYNKEITFNINPLQQINNLHLKNDQKKTNNQIIQNQAHPDSP